MVRLIRFRTEPDVLRDERHPGRREAAEYRLARLRRKRGPMTAGW